MNRNVFFEYVRKAPFGGRLTTDQVDGMTKILDEWENRGLTDDRWLAYLLATTTRETGFKMQPVREGGGEAYLRSKKYYPWVGEGLVQVTWKDNHKKFGATQPGQLMTWPIALKALFDGCVDGMFTGKKLGHYFNDKVDDPVGARRIVNGTDKAQLIAGYHKNFLDAIKKANEVTVAEAAKVEEVKTEDVKPSEHKGFLATALSALGGLGGMFSFSNIDNPFALGAFAIIAGAAVLGIWAVASGRIVIKR